MTTASSARAAISNPASPGETNRWTETHRAPAAPATAPAPQ